MKITLINVVLEGDYQYEQEIPLGLAYIGAYLRKYGYIVTLKQCFVGKKDNQFEPVSDAESDVYGFQLNMVNYRAVKAVVDEIKSVKPEAVTIFGGPYLVTISEDILRNEPLFDFVVIGEGEETALELIRTLERRERDFSRVNGLVWRDGSNAIIRNESRELIEDLDTLPFPARDFLENARRDPKDNGIIESFRMVTSRGCIGQCSFCCVNFYRNVQRGRAWRGRSPKNVVDELEYLSKIYKARVFNLSDSSFEDPGEYGKNRTRQICEEIINRQLPVSLKIYLRCETMRSERDIELLKLYKKAGIDIVIIGVEAGSDYELKLYEKNATVEDNYRMAGILKDLDLFYVMTGFIMFGPNSTMETIKNNIEFLRNFGFGDNLLLASGVLMLIRGSKLYRVLKDEGRVIESPNHWELPKYKIRDPLSGRMAGYFQNIFVTYPSAGQLNSLQINMGNLISRMTNPMNAGVLDSLRGDYSELKRRYAHLGSRLGDDMHEHYVSMARLIETDSSDEKLSAESELFFAKRCAEYLPLYSELYSDFLNKIVESGFSLSGLIFRNFTSAMTLEKIDRFDAGVKS